MDSSRTFRIAMVGQRGVPATFGGIERHVEELGSRLSERGHDVTVYCRPNYVRADYLQGGDRYRGMRVRVMPTIGRKHLDNIAHSAVSTVDAIRGRPDVVHYHAVGSGLVAPLPRYFSHSKVVLTVHAPDYDRDKWGAGARRVLKMAGWMSAHVPDATIVVARWLAAEYAEHWHGHTTVIQNGVRTPVFRPPREIRALHGLDRGTYVLFVGRIVPEKGIHHLLEAYHHVGGDKKLVIAGEPCFTEEYATLIRDLASRDPRVILVGYAYGEILEELYTNAAAFVQPSLLEGLPLTLLEAATYGLPIVATDIPAHTEVVGPTDAAVHLVAPGDVRALTSALAAVTVAPSSHPRSGSRLSTRVLANFDWDRNTRETERVYEAVLGIQHHEWPTPIGISNAARSKHIAALEETGWR